MLEFCGQDQCILDNNGRIKLSISLLRNFQRYSENDVILHCLPEKAIAVYPLQIWKSMRGSEQNKEFNAAQSLVFRRNLRRFGSMSLNVAISNQGRITIPPVFRDFAELTANSEIFLIGCEIGIEIWNQERWRIESELIQKHIFDKGEHEMNSDLIKETIYESGKE